MPRFRTRVAHDCNFSPEGFIQPFVHFETSGADNTIGIKTMMTRQILVSLMYFAAMGVFIGAYASVPM